jgi:RHS repeat-associated protein
VDGDGVNVTNNLRFPGQYHDQETGLHYNMARDYQPGIGRYIEGDRMGLNGGINIYAYVGGNPIGQIDPLGLFSVDEALGLWAHYCEGSGTSIAVSFASINWGDTQQRAIDQIKATVGSVCSERTIHVNYPMETRAAGIDSETIGRHVVTIQGTIQVHCDCTWAFSGDMSSSLGYDVYQFKPSNRGPLGELSAFIGRNRCPISGKSFNIYLCGKSPISASGTIGQK